MTSSVFWYQVFLAGSLYWATSSFGFAGYGIAVLFWAGHTITRIGTLSLFLLQSTTLAIVASFLWEMASQDLEIVRLKLQIYASENTAVFVLSGLGILMVFALYMYFARFSERVHDAALGFIKRSNHLVKNPGDVKTFCVDTVVDQTGISQFVEFGTKHYLDIPYAEKDEAKALGARWDKQKKQWYALQGADPELFARWGSRANNSGQAKRSEATLSIELVPKTAWFSNLRSELTEDEWDRVKKATFKAAGYLCEICGGKGPKHPVECHEKWIYEEQSNTQILAGTIALCPACHEATHYGLARVKNRSEQAKSHLMKVNGWGYKQVIQHINDAMSDYDFRSKVNWVLDARWLLGFVPLSAATKKKIQDHAKGVIERGIEDWQEEIVSAQEPTGSDQEIDSTAKVLLAVLIARLSHLGMIEPKYIGEFYGIDDLPRIEYPAIYYWQDLKASAIRISFNTPLMISLCINEARKQGAALDENHPALHDAIEAFCKMSLTSFEAAGLA